MDNVKIKRESLRLRISPFAEAVLATVAVAGLISVVAIAPGVATVMSPFLKKKKYSTTQVVNRNIDSLLKKKVLERVTQKDGSYAIRLSKKGRWEAGIRGLTKSTTLDQEWDGLWRLVIFDIPEDKRRIRSELRRAVSLYGFNQLQKSVWIYPYPCDEFVVLVKNHLGISNDVLYMTVNYLENDKWLKKDFKLK